MGKIVYVTKLPDCDFCKNSNSPRANTRSAKYDFKTKWGPWANGCAAHFRQHAAQPDVLGTGWGQELRVGEEPERTDDDIREDLAAAIEAGDYDAMEEALGDRDFAEFM